MTNETSTPEKTYTLAELVGEVREKSPVRHIFDKSAADVAVAWCGAVGRPLHIPNTPENRAGKRICTKCLAMGASR